MERITTEINRLLSVLQALTVQRSNALRLGNQSEADQIQSVQADIDWKIQDLERQLS